jgi:hypothetical protein
MLRSPSTLLFGAALCGALLLPAAARAEDPKTETLPPVAAPAAKAPEAKADAQCVRGRDLATSEEWKTQRALVLSAADDADLARVRSEWTAELEKRADAKGRPLCHETGMQPGLGRGPGPGAPAAEIPKPN